MASAHRPGRSGAARGAALLLLAGTLAACDLIPNDGYAKLSRRQREDVTVVTNPAPPPVVPGIGGGGGGAIPQLAANAPAGVTQAMVEQGASHFGTVCSACHGPGGTGTPAGPSLNDKQWIHISGNFDEIVNIINAGVPQPREYPGAMPPRGGGNFDEEQIRQLAAYVYALSQQGS